MFVGKLRVWVNTITALTLFAAKIFGGLHLFWVIGPIAFLNMGFILYDYFFLGKYITLFWGQPAGFVGKDPTPYGHTFTLFLVIIMFIFLALGVGIITIMDIKI